MAQLNTETHEALQNFAVMAEVWLHRTAQLELTPMEYRFNVDLRAALGAATAYIDGGQYSDPQLFMATIMSSTFCGRCLEHDSQFYDHYFNATNELLPNYAKYAIGCRLPLVARDDNIAVRFRNGDTVDE